MGTWHAVFILRFGLGCEEKITDGQVCDRDLREVDCIATGRNGEVNNAIHAREHA